MPRPGWSCCLLGLLATPAAAHFNMLLPQAASLKRSEAVTLIYQWGHPFEHELFAAPQPSRILVFAPDGQKSDVTGDLEKIEVQAAQTKVTGYRLRYTPEQRGDYTFMLHTAPIWMEEEHEFFQDAVKVVLHVQAQKGWDNATGQPFELLPLTRPYGLQPGMVFQAQALGEGKPLAAAMVEIERYNPTPPKQLPVDEQITRTVKTDPNGVATCTLPEAGWWCLTAQRGGGMMERDGKHYPLKQRTTFWLFVDEKGQR